MMGFTLHSMVSDHWCGLDPLYMVPCDNKEKEDHDVKIHETGRLILLDDPFITFDNNGTKEALSFIKEYISLPPETITVFREKRDAEVCISLLMYSTCNTDCD